jgi:hypothetical protein
MNTSTCLFHAGSSISLETLVTNHFTHHRNHHPGAQGKAEETEEVAEVEEVAEGVDYRLQQDPAYSCRTDEHPILTVPRKQTRSVHRGQNKG